MRSPAEILQSQADYFLRRIVSALPPLAKHKAQSETQERICGPSHLGPLPGLLFPQPSRSLVFSSLVHCHTTGTGGQFQGPP